MKCIRVIAIMVCASLSVLFTGCENEPVKFGNDGALLTHIEFSGARALVSEPAQESFEAGDSSYTSEVLFSVGENGIIQKPEFTVEGNSNGGFDKYLVYDLSDQFIMIAFPLRGESYLIDKSSGNATKVAYFIPQDTYWIPYKIVATGATDIYFEDASERTNHISNFLSNNPDTELLPIEAVDLHADKNGKLFYSHNSFVSQVTFLNPYIYAQMFTYHNNAEKEIAQNVYGTWVDLDGEFNMIFADGKIAQTSNAELSQQTALPLIHPPFHAGLKILNFPNLDKTIVLGTDNSGDNVVAELFPLRKVMTKITDEFSFSEVFADSFEKYALALLFDSGGNTFLYRIDVSNYSFMKFPIDKTGAPSRVYAIDDHEMIMETCDGAGSGCYITLKLIDTNGDVTDLLGPNRGGKVIKL